MEGKGNMRDRFDIDQVIKITGLGIHAEQADDEPFVMLDDAVEIVKSGGIE